MSKKNKTPLEPAMEITSEVLRENNIAFEVKNKGYHISIRTDKNRYDYWPTTGKWMKNSDFKIQTGGITQLVEEILEEKKLHQDDIVDRIFSKDIEVMDTEELKETIYLLCDYISKNVK